MSGRTGQPWQDRRLFHFLFLRRTKPYKIGSYQLELVAGTGSYRIEIKKRYSPCTEQAFGPRKEGGRETGRGEPEFENRERTGELGAERKVKGAVFGQTASACTVLIGVVFFALVAPLADECLWLHGSGPHSAKDLLLPGEEDGCDPGAVPPSYPSPPTPYLPKQSPQTRLAPRRLTTEEGAMVPVGDGAKGERVLPTAATAALASASAHVLEAVSQLWVLVCFCAARTPLVPTVRPALVSPHSLPECRNFLRCSHSLGSTCWFSVHVRVCARPCWRPPSSCPRRNVLSGAAARPSRRSAFSAPSVECSPWHPCVLDPLFIGVYVFLFPGFFPDFCRTHCQELLEDAFGR